MPEPSERDNSNAQSAGDSENGDEDLSPVSLIVDLAVAISQLFFKDSKVGEYIEAFAPIIKMIGSKLFNEDDRELNLETETRSTESVETSSTLEKTYEDTPTGGASNVDDIIDKGIEKYLNLPTGTINVVNHEINQNIKEIDRTQEKQVNISDLPKNNDDFFEQERLKNASWLMRINADKNNGRPDAKLFMDIALVQPKRVPSTQDYQFISSDRNKELNEKYNLTGNKTIPEHYDGFKFSANSPTAHALNNSEEFRKQIFDEKKNFNKEIGKFKSDKLEIDFQDDKNLKYSFGHMTVLNPKIADNGYVEGGAFDLYNYSVMLKEYIKGDVLGTFYNNGAKVLQSTGHLKNYYIFIPVKLKI